MNASATTFDATSRDASAPGLPPGWAATVCEMVARLDKVRSQRAHCLAIIAPEGVPENEYGPRSKVNDALREMVVVAEDSAFRELIQLAERTCAPPGGHLDIPEGPYRERFVDAEDRGRRARYRDSGGRRDFDPRAMATALAVEFGGQRGVDLGRAQSAEALISLLELGHWRRLEPEVLRAGVRFTVNAYMDTYFPDRYADNCLEALRNLRWRLVEFLRWAEHGHIEPPAHFDKPQPGQQLSVGPVRIQLYKSSFKLLFPHELAAQLNLYLTQFAPERMAQVLARAS